MKVLYVLSLDDNFGAPRALMEMIQTLKKQYNITPVVLTPLKNKINDECDKLNIENYHILYGTSMYRKGDKLLNVLRYLLYKYGNIVSLRLIKNKINFDEIDFIHSNNSVIDFGYRLSKKYNKKHFWHLREFSDLDFNYYPFEKKYYSKMNESINIGISQTIIDAWKKKGLRNINLVYDGLDFSSIKTKKKYIKSEKIKMIFIGSICETKGQFNFIKTFSKIDRKVINNFELDIYGSGFKEYINRIKKYVKDNNLEDIINLKGYEKNIRNIIPNYDIGIVNSKCEAFGRVTIEYMSSGLLVLACSTGSNIELIKNKKTGLLFKRNDANSLEDALKLIINNNKLVKEISIEGRKYSTNKYSKEENAKNVYKLYLKEDNK